MKLIILAVLVVATIVLMILQLLSAGTKTDSDKITVGQALRAIARTRYAEDSLQGEDAALGLLVQDKIVDKGIDTDKDLTYQALRQWMQNCNINSDEMDQIFAGKKGKVSLQDWSAAFEYFYLISPYRNEFLVCEMTVAGYEDNSIFCKEGKYTYMGTSGKNFFHSYGDKKIQAMTYGKEILFVQEILENEAVYENVWIISGKEGQLQAYMYGGERSYHTSMEDTIEDTVADITVKEGKIAKISLKRDEIEGKVLSIDRSFIEIEGFGKIPLDDNFRVYKNYGNLQEAGYKNILVGYNVQNFVVAKGKICAAVIHSDIHAQNIRVLLKTTGFENIYHEKVVLTCDSDFKITYGKKEKVIQAGKKLTLTPESKYLKSGRIHIAPVKKNAKLQVKSIERSYGNPVYRGSLEVTAEEEGMLIVNELSLEEYLYAVVPSEMPVSYGQVALMVQAVCARTYAYRQMLDNSYSMYGAHVDDSVSFQVYNNVLESEDSINAVKATYGMIMTYEKQPIQAFFFSTSCGATTEADIWGNANPPYIRSRYLSGEDELDLTDEKVFDRFIREQADTYDSVYDMYRWKVTLSQNEVTESVNRAIAYMPELETSDIGTVTGIKAKERGKGGVLKSIQVKGTKGTVVVKLQSNIRQLFDVSGHEFTLQNGHFSGGFSSLPSACFVVDKEENGDSIQFTFLGGGYGHGVGMSQNATKTMAEEGMTYEEILEFFYQNITLENAYDL